VSNSDLAKAIDRNTMSATRSRPFQTRPQVVTVTTLTNVDDALSDASDSSIELHHGEPLVNEIVSTPLVSASAVVTPALARSSSHTGVAAPFTAPSTSLAGAPSILLWLLIEVSFKHLLRGTC
jgi:hypothetical protein